MVVVFLELEGASHPQGFSCGITPTEKKLQYPDDFTLRGQTVEKLTEVSMLRLMLGVCWLERIRNVEITLLGHVVTGMKDREKCLR